MALSTLDSNAARAHWRRVLDKASAGGDTVIERYGQPTAAIIPYNDFLALQEELEDLRAARRAAETLEAWEHDPSRGRSYAEIRAELVKEGLLDA
jgi:prevent-host-death family protein